VASDRPLADRADRILSVSAVVAAAAAVLVSVYQAQLARAQQKAAAWPYVTQGNSMVRGQPYRWLVQNAGVGPARVRSFEVLVDRRPQRTWSQAVRALSGDADPGLVYSHLGRGSVILPGATVEALVLPADEPATMRFYVGAQTRLAGRLCYCSVYDDCWVADSDAPEPTPVPACTLVDSAQAFRN
jgi:hypothetical protein